MPRLSNKMSSIYQLGERGHNCLRRASIQTEWLYSCAVVYPGIQSPSLGLEQFNLCLVALVCLSKGDSVSWCISPPIPSTDFSGSLEGSSREERNFQMAAATSFGPHSQVPVFHALWETQTAGKGPMQISQSWVQVFQDSEEARPDETGELGRVGQLCTLPTSKYWYVWLCGKRIQVSVRCSRVMGG